MTKHPKLWDFVAWLLKERQRRPLRWWLYRYHPTRLWQWWTAPFRVRVDFFERTRVEHRAFPYRLRMQRVESLQERLDRGGTVRVPAGTWHTDQPFNVTRPTSIIGATIRGHEGTTALRVNPDA